MFEFRQGRGVVTPIARREYDGFVRETETPRYRSPRALRATGAAPHAMEATLSLSLAARFDIISWINTAIGRFLARRIFHPIQYVFDVQYALRTASAESAPVTGTNGVALLWILNQPKDALWP
jgi:hypothetical protein